MERSFEVQLKIRKPVGEVFEAVVDPRKLSGYFTKTASGRRTLSRTSASAGGPRTNEISQAQKKSAMTEPKRLTTSPSSRNTQRVSSTIARPSTMRMASRSLIGALRGAGAARRAIAAAAQV